ARVVAAPTRLVAGGVAAAVAGRFGAPLARGFAGGCRRLLTGGGRAFGGAVRRAVRGRSVMGAAGEAPRRQQREGPEEGEGTGVPDVVRVAHVKHSSMHGCTC